MKRVSAQAKAVWPSVMQQWWDRHGGKALTKLQAASMIEMSDEWQIIGEEVGGIGWREFFKRVNKCIFSPDQTIVLHCSSERDQYGELVAMYRASQRVTHDAPVNINVRLGDDDGSIASDPNELTSLIDLILRRQERRTLRSVTQSRAMQAIIVRLSAALDGDESTLRAVVAEVLDDLGHAVTWNE